MSGPIIMGDMICKHYNNGVKKNAAEPKRHGIDNSLGAVSHCSVLS